MLATSSVGVSHDIVKHKKESLKLHRQQQAPRSNFGCFTAIIQNNTEEKTLPIQCTNQEYRQETSPPHPEHRRLSTAYSYQPQRSHGYTFLSLAKTMNQKSDSLFIYLKKHFKLNSSPHLPVHCSPPSAPKKINKLNWQCTFSNRSNWTNKIIFFASNRSTILWSFHINNSNKWK